MKLYGIQFKPRAKWFRVYCFALSDVIEIYKNQEAALENGTSKIPPLYTGSEPLTPSQPQGQMDPESLCVCRRTDLSSHSAHCDSHLGFLFSRSSHQPLPTLPIKGHKNGTKKSQLRNEYQ